VSSTERVTIPHYFQASDCYRSLSPQQSFVTGGVIAVVFGQRGADNSSLPAAATAGTERKLL
jgi:hypothetical protein